MGRVVRSPALGLLAALLVGSAALAVAADPPGLGPGTYVQVDPVTKKPLELGSQIVVIAAKGGRLGFSISALRSLDLHLGFVAGVLEPQLPATWTRSSAGGNCRLRFERVPHGVRVTQDDAYGDCGFGDGVTASGTYLFAAEKGP